MPALVSTRAKKGEETREAILGACLNLFARKGFASTSIDDIAGAAAITKGAVYWHFKNKEELFHEILKRIRSRWHEVVLRPVKAQTSTSVRLERLFDGYIELFTEAPEKCLFLQRILLEDDEVFSPQVARIFRQTAQFIAKILDEGKEQGDFRADVNALLVAHSILGGLSGATQQSIANRSVKLSALMQEVRDATLARMRS